MNNVLPASIIVGNYVAPGQTFPGTIVPAGAASPSVAGGGDLTSIFGAVATAWEGILGDNFTLTVDYGWAGTGGGVVASTTVRGTGGSPTRIQRVSILIDNSGSTAFYLDPTPADSTEWDTLTQSTGDLGGGMMVTGRVYSAPNLAAPIGRWDMFSVLLHEVGHGLGLSSSYSGYTTEVADGKVDVTAPLPYAGSSIPTNGVGNPHLANSLPNALMISAPVAVGQRVLASDADILAIAQVSHVTSVNLPPSWRLAAGGDWSLAANWTGYPLPPNAVNAAVTFGVGTTAPVRVNVPVTLGSITFSATSPCTLAGPQTLTMQVSSGVASIQLDRALTQTITGPLVLASDTQISGLGTLSTATITNNGHLTALTTVNATGALTGVGTLTVGAGTTFSVPTLNQAGLALADNGTAGATVKLTYQWLNGISPPAPSDSTVPMANLSFGAHGLGKLDIGKSGVVLAGTNYASVVALLDPALVSGGRGSGNLISTAMTRPASTIAVVGEGAGNVLARYTWAGDANVDGRVDLSDLAILSADYGTLGGATWAQGDFNYDGRVDLLDLAVLARNYSAGVQSPPAGSGLPDGVAAVPEPATGLVLLMLVPGLAGRSGRGSRGLRGFRARRVAGVAHL